MSSKKFLAGVVVGMGIVAAIAATTFRVGSEANLAGNQVESTGQTQSPLAQDAPATSLRGGGWRAGEGSRRELAEEDIDRVIATARDVNPEWADALEKLRKTDPAALREKISREARKLMGLSMMKEREPKLYKVRVEDMRVQNQIRESSDSWNAAKKNGDTAAQELTMKEIEINVRKQVELDIQARGFELVALDRSLKDASKRLQDDIRDREKLITEMLEAIRKGEDPKFGRKPSGMGSSMGGFGGRSRGNDNEPASKPASTNP